MKLISSPTKKDWIVVMKKAIKEGYAWYRSCEDDIDEKTWNVYKKESVIHLRDNKQIKFCDKEFYSKKYPYDPVLTTQQYLQKEGGDKNAN